MGHDEMVVGDAQLLTQRLAVCLDILLAVATIAVDVERGIVALAATSAAGGAKGYHTGSHIVIIELRSVHAAKIGFIVTQLSHLPIRR